jgi:hypothetical protein
LLHLASYFGHSTAGKLHAAVGADLLRIARHVIGVDRLVERQLEAAGDGLPGSCADDAQ